MLFACKKIMVFTLKVENLPTITIFGLKLTLKSGLEKMVLEILHYFINNGGISK